PSATSTTTPNCWIYDRDDNPHRHCGGGNIYERGAMNILSLFDGMSCGQIALRELGVEVSRYYASEIDKHAIAQTMLNFPETIQLGDVTQWRTWDIDWSSIDLILAGSPCQGFSLAGKMLGHDDPRSRLYWVFLDILRHVQACNPNVKYLLENVRMRPQDERMINESLGIMPVVINSALVSAQNRVRLYWSNIRIRRHGLWDDLYTDIPQPADRGIYIQDILEEEVDAKYYIDSGVWGQDIAGKSRALRVGGALSPDAKHAWDVIKLDRNLSPKAQQGKASCLTAGGHSGGNHSDMDVLAITAGTWRTHKRDRGFREVSGSKAPCMLARARNDGSGQPCVQYGYQLRRLTPTECARLQTIPDWYQWGCSDTQAYKMLGNGWTVEVIKHILSYIV
ncbi:MAG: DNA (cytosine-5-)-methyltransferase, partial [Porphyromonadaceae bacterium]|nr:DNA (cytosine-5-)-methyltransferase [Porphyromonadaceae bacterium]